MEKVTQNTVNKLVNYSKNFESSSLNRTVMLNDKTKEIVSNLIKREFFSVKEGEYWKYQRQDELIKAALNMGLSGLAAELTLFT